MRHDRRHVHDRSGETRMQIVYRAANQTVYRCIKAHTNQTPPNATYWSTAMFGYSAVVAAPAISAPAKRIEPAKGR